jgi:hypothetical protein
MIRHGITWVDLGKVMTGMQGRPVTGNAAMKALTQPRMPVVNHRCIREAYPALPPALLPVPQDVPAGRKITIPEGALARVCPPVPALPPGRESAAASGP